MIDPKPGQIWRNKRSTRTIRIVDKAALQLLDPRLVGKAANGTGPIGVLIQWPLNKVQCIVTLDHLNNDWYLYYDDQAPQEHVENSIDTLEKILYG